MNPFIIVSALVLIPTMGLFMHYGLVFRRSHSTLFIIFLGIVAVTCTSLRRALDSVWDIHRMQVDAACRDQKVKS